MLGNQKAISMNHAHNRTLYRLWSPLYDRIFGPLFAHARQDAIRALEMQPDECLLIPGIGTGLDIPLLPTEISVVGIDFSAAMLAQAREKVGERDITLHEMDAQRLNFESDAFDAVLCNLILSVVPDGAAAFREAWRVLKPGGRMVIFDKFLADEEPLTMGRRVIGSLVRAFGTDPNRRLCDITAGVEGVTVERDDPSLLRGRYRILLLRKG